MSRVIKFRAWFDSHGFMGNVTTLKGSNRTNYDADMWDEVTAECYVDGKQQFFSSYNFKLLQFTGLLDKNGKEVYEGDLVECIYETVLPYWDGWGRDIPNPGPPQTQTTLERYEVFYNDMRGEFRMRSIKYYNNTRNLYERTNLEVIGNIYQNPELLK